MGWCVLELSVSGDWLVVGSCEHSIETLGSIQSKEFLSALLVPLEGLCSMEFR